MKWINKGHEFDEVGKRFENLKRIYLYGAGLYGKQTRMPSLNANPSGLLS